MGGVMRRERCVTIVKMKVLIFIQLYLLLSAFPLRHATIERLFVQTRTLATFRFSCQSLKKTKRLQMTRIEVSNQA